MAGKKKSLSPNQEKFCQLYVKTGNAKQSYLNAGYNCSEKAAETSSSTLLRNPKVSKRIDKLRQNIEKKAELSSERIIKQLEAQAMQDLNKVLRIDESGLKIRDDISEEIDVNLLNGVSMSESISDSGISRSFSVKLSDRLKANVELLKLRGLYEKGRAQSSEGDRISNSKRILEATRRFRK